MLSWNYIAGLMDGDGSFSLIRKVRGKSVGYYPLIQFSNSNKATVYALKDMFGGSVHVRESWVGKDGVRRKTNYTWKFEKLASHEFLKTLEPYLVLKRDRVAFLNKYIQDNPFKRGQRISAEKQLERKSAWINMKAMNTSLDSRGNIKLKTDRRMTSSRAFWEYCAGIVDTDGSMSIKRETGKCKQPVYSAVINITMCWSGALCYIYNKSGVGKLYIVGAKTALSGQAFRYGIYSKDEVVRFVKKLLPYLKIKKRAASILLEFCEGYVAQTGRYLKTQKQQDFREDCYQRLIEANKYGVYKPSLMDLKPLPGNAEGNKAEAGDEPGTVNVVSEKAPEGDAEL